MIENFTPVPHPLWTAARDEDGGVGMGAVIGWRYTDDTYVPVVAFPGEPAKALPDACLFASSHAAAQFIDAVKALAEDEQDAL